MRKQTAFDRFCKQTHQGWFSIAVTMLRIGIGFVFLNAGLSKMKDWSAEEYLQGATGPLAEWFMSLAGNPLVDQLNIWGLTLIGLGLVLGIFVRPAAFFGIVVMVLYYLSDFEGNTAHGLIDEHVVYALIFAVFLSGGVGHVFGLDGLLSGRMRKQTWVTRVLFG